MMIKRIAIFGLTILTATTLVACGNPDTSTDKTPKTEETAKDKVSTTKTVDNIDMKIANLKLTESGDGKQDILQIEMNIQNNSTTPFAIGGGDFKLKTAKDKTIKVDPQASNFGDEIAAGKTLTGKAYFNLPKDTEKATLVYQPKDKAEAQWEVTIPEKE
ncbi:hypothetical protein BMT55_00905 [Listeria newyorkensis]|uniref:DUF4352 domain-containing protein n=1 Tax=Listeria newyorkensis TaxID=1497681 RepID=A0ABX4XR47_9LIST|nr:MULTISPECIES: DUF4352 domain-containing protein [Listeria]KGL39095.1 hypothetical protein EP56_14360 [Listeriaceae bacterium FSL A5-0209]PNP94939.1 hypothetical protein BMT55_00905 [Listeria newyorkensis]